MLHNRLGYFMPTYSVTVHIFINEQVLNPEERPVARALHQLGFTEVASVKMGKCHIVTLNAPSNATAIERVKNMCEKLLANPVTEHFTIHSVEVVREVPKDGT